MKSARYWSQAALYSGPFLKRDLMASVTKVTLRAPRHGGGYSLDNLWLQYSVKIQQGCHIKPRESRIYNSGLPTFVSFEEEARTDLHAKRVCSPIRIEF